MDDVEPRRTRRSRAWTRAQWRAHISAQVSSGLTGAGYCRSHGLRPKSFYRWKRILRDSGELEALLQEAAEPAARAGKGTKPLFAEVQMPGDTTAVASGVEVALGSGRVVRVSRDFDAETLRRVVSALEAGAC